MEAAQLVPFGGVAREVFGGACLTRRADRAEMLAILSALAAKPAISGFGGNQHAGERSPKIVCRTGFTDGSAQKHPAPFAAALGKTGIAQDLDVAGYARLALAQHLRELAHSKLHAGKQAHNPETSRIGEGTESIENRHGFGIRRSLYLSSHIKTSLYGIPILGVGPFAICVALAGRLERAPQPAASAGSMTMTSIRYPPMAKTSKTHSFKLLAAALAGASLLALSACGSSDDASESATADNVEMPADDMPSAEPSAAAALPMAPAADASAAAMSAEDAAKSAADSAVSAAEAAKAAAAEAEAPKTQ